MNEESPSWPEHFASELKLARESAGFSSQQRLAAAVGWSRSRIADIESGELPPLEFVDACERLLKTDGLLRRIWKRAKHADVSSWLLELIDAEAEATAIRAFEPSFFPGLLQTPEYARAVLTSGRYALRSDNDIDGRVSVRTQRQAVLRRETLRSYWVVIDESVLYRRVGGDDVMRGQLRHVLSVIDELPVRVQILPYAAGGHVAAGPMTILEVKDRGTLVHLDGPVSGTTTSEPTIVSGCIELFDVLRAQAASLADSVELMASQLEEI